MKNYVIYVIPKDKDDRWESQPMNLLTTLDTGILKILEEWMKKVILDNLQIDKQDKKN